MVGAIIVQAVAILFAVFTIFTLSLNATADANMLNHGFYDPRLLSFCVLIVLKKKYTIF